ncbi:MAG: protein translocase subunit SecF [Actinobacteria bacterium]|nr:MAG: protein translocase subunit SecF [Actinomycetota bacterium]
MPKFDFIGRSKIWLIISSVVILTAILTVSIRGLNFGVEFTGGTLINVKLDKVVNISEVRQMLAKYNLQKSIIQPIGVKEYLIRFKKDQAEEKNRDLANNVVAGLGKLAKVQDHTIEQVGPGWGQQITNAAIWAAVLSFAALLIYISLRFEFKMAIGAIAALIHDILFTVGVYSLVYREVTPATVAALLTIMGYSLYDTIVVFHKIVENSKTLQRKSYATMVNYSINQVLIRSLNTSITSILPVIAILAFGGETLKDFAFALMVGLFIGVYSSIFVASPLLVAWKETEPRFRNLKKKFGYQASQT